MCYKKMFTVLLVLASIAQARGQTEADLERINWGVQGEAELKDSINDFAKANGHNFRANSFKEWRVYSVNNVDCKSYTKISEFPLIEGAKMVDQLSLETRIISNPDGGVVAVQMEHTDSIPGGSTFATIQNFLEGRYAKPKTDVVLKNAELNIEKQSITWGTDNTVIELVKLNIPDQGLYRVSLTYRGKSPETAKGVQN